MMRRNQLYNSRRSTWHIGRRLSAAGDFSCVLNVSWIMHACTTKWICIYGKLIETRSQIESAARCSTLLCDNCRRRRRRAMRTARRKLQDDSIQCTRKRQQQMAISYNSEHTCEILHAVPAPIAGVARVICFGIAAQERRQQRAHAVFFPFSYFYYIIKSHREARQCQMHV